MGGGRAETAGNLVLTLGAGLKVGQAVFQTILDALVVTHFKVQSGQVDGGPPVTTVQAVAAAQAQCARHRLAIDLREEQDDLRRQEIGSASGRERVGQYV